VLRLVGFAPEPSFGAISTMGLIGLLAADLVLRRRSYAWRGLRTPLVLLVIVVLFGFELVLANARTFAISALGIAVAAAVLTPPARRVPAALRSLAIVCAPMAIQALMIYLVLHADASGRTSSNVSRSVGMLTATEVGAQHPLFGVGFGQYGFHFRSLVPSWGLESWEVSKFFRDDQHDLVGGLPPSFSIYSRIAAELGVPGLAAWLAPPILAIRRAMLRRPDALTSVIVCAFAAQAWSGLSLDSFRNIYYWLWLAMMLAWPTQYEAASPVRRPASA
jgi:hypothetical protein